MDAGAVRSRANELSREPGVYQFLDGRRVLYVGKALDLRDRVRSYADPRSERVREMVRQAGEIDVAVTDTETQALLLEANLIKRHQPRYNVRLKDDKSYPLVQFSAHQFPRIEITRDPDPDAAVYGPYTNKGELEAVMKAVRETTGLRGCSTYKFANRDRPCIDHDMGLCSAPCVDAVEEETYAAAVREAERFFEGATGAIARPLRESMNEAADRQAYERAANLRDRLEAVEAFHGSGGAAVARADEKRVRDVLGVAVEGDRATVARLHSEGGKLVERERHRVTLPDGDGGVAEVLGAFVPQFYAERELPEELLLPQDPASEELAGWLADAGVGLRVPGAGPESRLIDLAMKNAHQGGDRGDAHRGLADALGIAVPARLEGFDVSHAGGREVVGSDVTFLDGTPRKADYRRKKLPERNDDPANVRALIEWRASRALEGRDERPDPDLLVIDGGVAQLEAARAALDGTGWSVPICSLAKAEERVHTPDRQFDWASTDPKLHLLQRVRDEAHRFAVQYHQTLRDDVSTVLESIEGIGPQRRKRLLRRFGSVEGVRAASEEELADVEGIGSATARQLTERL